MKKNIIVSILNTPLFGNRRIIADTNILRFAQLSVVCNLSLSRSDCSSLVYTIARVNDALLMETGEAASDRLCIRMAADAVLSKVNSRLFVPAATAATAVAAIARPNPNLDDSCEAAMGKRTSIYIHGTGQTLQEGYSRRAAASCIAPTD